MHDGARLDHVDAAWLTESGQLLLQNAGTLAQMDDRDLIDVLPSLRLDGLPVDDAHLLQWVAGNSEDLLTLVYGKQRIGVQRIASAEVAARFGFIRQPTAEPVDAAREPAAAQPRR